MEKPIIVANWKSKKTPSEAKDWIEKINILNKFTPLSLKQPFILCAPFLDIPIIKELQEKSSLPFIPAAQNISPDQEKSLTGETTADMLSGYVSYVMIGHSERRQNLGETDDLVNQQIAQAIGHGIKTIVCVSQVSQAESIKKAFPNYEGIILYEPLFAIGTGKTDKPDSAGQMAQNIKVVLPHASITYGGSVTAQSASGFIKQSAIDGLAIGKASLEASSFFEILKNVSQV